VKLPWIVSVPVLIGGLILIPKDTSAKPEYSRMTDQDCAYCHEPKSRKLTNAGVYYRQHRTLKGFIPPKTR
jgi:hypothetical protein